VSPSEAASTGQGFTRCDRHAIRAGIRQGAGNVGSRRAAGHVRWNLVRGHIGSECDPALRDHTGGILYHHEHHSDEQRGRRSIAVTYTGSRRHRPAVSLLAYAIWGTAYRVGGGMLIWGIVHAPPDGSASLYGCRTWIRYQGCTYSNTRASVYTDPPVNLRQRHSQYTYRQGLTRMVDALCTYMRTSHPHNSVSGHS